ncbi:SHOCT domain-containing protein [candidate division KSB1 bacterium]|nr:SHOCT domain-containing protein [candidate division KSB1 bacterium]
MMYQWSPFHGSWIAMVIQIISWLILFGLLIWGIRAFTSRRPLSSPNHSALDILRERYARGEIDKNEFKEKKKDLTS